MLFLFGGFDILDAVRDENIQRQVWKVLHTVCLHILLYNDITSVVVKQRLSWLNVLSFDVCRTTTSLTANIGMPKKTRFYKNMLYYSAYAILVPLICTMFFIIGNKVYDPKGRFTPKINKITCYIDLRKIDDNLGLLHLYIPVTILILVNIVLFVKTVRYFLRTKQNMNNFADSTASRAGHKKNVHEKKIIIIKLALLMGITWIYYIYSYLNNIQGSDTMQHIGDIIGFANTFEGVYFLLIFAVNWRKVKKFLHFCR
ncbi:7 transmembrane receptor (Secretin family) [Popillia japonica]|uniref:7 transmembrane receptor (Secretin family) n=1 Tax=Popillia japonica TaxID=7064 RepID=A0AAW1LLV2_POPJA